TRAMGNGSGGTLLGQVHRLFGAGTVSGIAEEQLVDRFLTAQDEAAFAAIVARHGPMVWSVCRRFVPHGHAAEDAFQAVFLVFVRKAGSLRDRAALGPWLHGVATRVATRARAVAARRRSLERVDIDPAMLPAANRSADCVDLREILDQEIG